MMKRKILVLLCLAAVLWSGCSSSTHMPKHRKRRHCDCPTFSDRQPGQNEWINYTAMS